MPELLGMTGAGQQCLKCRQGADGIEVLLRLGQRAQFRIELERIAQKFQSFRRPVLDRSITGHIKICQCVPRIRMERPLQGRGGRLHGLRPPPDIRQINPQTGIVRIQFGKLGHKWLGFLQPVLLPKNSRLDSEGVRLARRQRQGHIGLTQGLVEHFQIEIAGRVLDVFLNFNIHQPEYSTVCNMICQIRLERLANPRYNLTVPPIEQLLEPLLARDGWSLCGTEARRGSRRITFFPTSRVTPALTKSLRAIVRSDAGRFRHIGVVVTTSSDQMNRLRTGRSAGKLPRAFFTSLEELEGESPCKLAQLRAGPRLAGRLALHQSRISSFNATIVANTPVGPTPPVHYRLVFDAPALGDIVPPQFFMMDVLPTRTPLGARAVRRAGWHDAVDWSPQPLLKRPFGLCRAYRPQFPVDYLKRLKLPPALASVLHPPAATRFDLLYKVLPEGVGTPLLPKLRKGDKVHMVGPLGQTFDVRALRAAGIEEVHIIGGGVGMAPLILLVEELRFHSFHVKVFLGMATLESLRYRDELAATFGEKPRDAYVYIDDLLAAGVAPADIFLACDREFPRHVRRIPKDNMFHGLVPEQYRRFLVARSAAGAVQAFTCGPNRMMEVMTEVTHAAGVPLKVLLEKRMGCGFGVCFSCVQKVRRADGTTDYVRVCKDGPIFDAKDIVWKNDDSKQPSANCGCAARS